MPRRKATPVQAAPTPPAESTKKLPKKKTTKKKIEKASPRRAPLVRKKKTLPPTVSDGAPHAEPRQSVSPAPQIRTQTKTRAMTSTECFLYGGVVCLVGTIALGLLLGFVILPPFVAKFQSSQYSYAAPLTGNDPATLTLPSTVQQNDGVPEQEEFGFYGTILSKEKDVVMVQELLPPLPLEKSEEKPGPAKTFVVRVSEGTEYTYQKPREKDNVTAPLFTPEPGSLDQMKEKMFVFVSSGDDPEKMETVQAQHILFSELSPFAE